MAVVVIVTITTLSAAGVFCDCRHHHHGGSKITTTTHPRRYHYRHHNNNFLATTSANTTSTTTITVSTSTTAFVALIAFLFLLFLLDLDAPAATLRPDPRRVGDSLLPPEPALEPHGLRAARGLLVASLASGGALAAPALRHSGLVDAVKKRLAFGFLPEQKQETTPHPTTDTAANSKTLLPMSKPETKNTATAMSKTETRMSKPETKNTATTMSKAETRKKAVAAAGVARRAARLQESAKNAKQVAEELDELLDHSSELVGRLKIDERVSPSRPPRSSRSRSRSRSRRRRNCSC